MIDTHCHLNFEAFKSDVSDVIKRAERVGVKKFIVPGAKLDSSERAVLLSEQFGNVFAAVGVHPHHVSDFNEEVLKKIEELLKNPKVVAVGEIGLDLYQYQKSKIKNQKQNLETQKNILNKQLLLALKYNKPCIIHCREAHEEIDNFLKDYRIRGVFHCFSGDLQHLTRVLEMGFYVSFAGNVTYDFTYDELIKTAPLDRLLLETDSPFLAPMPLRGQRNEPKNLSENAKYIAETKNIGLNELLESSTINAERLFNLC